MNTITIRQNSTIPISIQTKCEASALESYINLIGYIHQTILDLTRVMNRTERLIHKVEMSQDDEYLDGVALNLHSFYTGLEKLFENIALSFEKSSPSGSHWGQESALPDVD